MDQKLLVIGGAILVLVIAITIVLHVGGNSNRMHFQDEGQFYYSMKARLGLPLDASKEEVDAALNLPKNATPEMVFQAMREKFGNEFDFNRENFDYNKNFQERRYFE